MAREWVRTHCARFDHGACGLRVLVEDGRAIKVGPDRDHPLSRGYCCGKGLATIERLYHPKRLTRPLMRTGPRGSGRWKPIGWDEALDCLASRFQESRSRLGPESLAFAQGAPKGLEFLMLLRLANLLQVPTVAAPQHVCHMPREQMAMLTCGFFPVADLDNPTACLLVWGGNPANTNEEGVLGAHVMRRLADGASLIVVDPVRTGLTHKASVWLRIRPGTDDVLALGLLHVVLEENLFDADFVEHWTVGFEALREAVRPYDPERVAAATWIPRERIVEAARLYARSRPAALQWGNAIEHTANSSSTCRALVALMAVTGNLEAPGGNIRARGPRLLRMRDFLCLDHFPGRAERLINRRFGIMPRLLTTPTWMLVRSILDQAPHSVRCLYVQGANPLVSWADVEQVREALMGLDFLAVAEQVMTPTAALADLVLPIATNLEFNDMGHYGLPHGYLLARPRVVDPPPECWPDLKIINEWGKRMGLGEHLFPNEDAILDSVLGPAGVTYEEFARLGVLRGEPEYHSYRHKGFATPSGKVELASEQLARWGFPPVPLAQEPPEPPAGYPLVLTSAKPRVYFHSAYRHLDSLRRRHPEPRVRLHPDTASELGITDGRRVRIVTPSGAVVQRADITDAVDPRVVVADYGWWFPEREESELFGWKEANINCLTSTEGPFDPVMGSTPLRGLPCRLERVDE